MSGLTVVVIMFYLAIGRPLYGVYRYVRTGQFGQRDRRSGRPPYLEELASRLADEETVPGRTRGALDLMVGLAAAFPVVGWMPHQFGARNPVEGILVLLSYVVGYLIAAAITVTAIHGLRRATAPLPAYAAGIATVVAGFVVPFDPPPPPDRADLLAEHAARTAAARQSWRADVESAGVHGPLGKPPPLLAVIDEGRRVYVTNVTAAEIPCVELARVEPARDGSAQRRCPLQDTGGPNRCYTIGVNSTVEYRLTPDSDQQACASLDLEFRVGNYEHPEPSWWSDTALADFDAKRLDASDPVGGDQAHPLETTRTESLNDHMVAFESARLEALTGDPDRAQRWRHELAASASRKQAHLEARQEARPR